MPDNERPVPNYASSTVRDYGHRLPIGVVGGNPTSLHKNFDFGRWRWKDEKRIAGKLGAADGPGGHDGKIVVAVLAEILTEWGQYKDFQKMDPAARRYAVESSHMEDVLYAWICLRVHALGEDLTLDVTCQTPGCDHKWEWTGDLRNIEITTTETLVEPVSFELRHPLEYGGKEWPKLSLEPPLWRGMCNVQLSAGAPVLSGILGEISIASIRSLEDESGEKMACLPDVADELSKLDMERLTRALMDKFPATDTQFEFECDSGHVHKTPVSWGYDFFFGAASLPRT